MEKLNISNVSFQGAATLFFVLGGNSLLEKDYLIGTLFVLGALALLVAREVLKKKLGIEIKDTK